MPVDLSTLNDGYVDVVFDGPPSPQEAGCSAPHFVEVEDAGKHSIRFCSWIERDDGYWVLRLTTKDFEELES